MKTIRFILIGLVLGIVSGSINHSALAQKEVKLIGVEDGVLMTICPPLLSGTP